MKKILLKLAAAVLVGGALVSSLTAGYYSLSWSASESSYKYDEVNVPSACSVTTTVYASGGGYGWAMAWGATNGFNKGEYNGPLGWSPWEYGTSTADLYYVEAEGSNNLYGYASAYVVISW